MAAAPAGRRSSRELFIGFSFFLIAAAALLVAMLFRLNIEQRARQLGLMAAVGFAPGKLRRLALVRGDGRSPSSAAWSAWPARSATPG